MHLGPYHEQCDLRSVGSGSCPVVLPVPFPPPPSSFWSAKGCQEGLANQHCTIGTVKIALRQGGVPINPLDMVGKEV